MKRLFYLAMVFSAIIAGCNSEKEKIEVENKGVKIAYNSCGEGDTTLLFLHGWCINKSYWEPQLKAFCPQYKVVAIDLPGFGESGKNREPNFDSGKNRVWNFDDYADDVNAVIGQLKLKNVILIGHSMSGDILLKVSNKYPSDVIAIVGVDNLHEPAPPVESADQKEMTEHFLDMLHTNFDTTVNRYMKGNLFQPTTPQPIVDRVMNDVFNSDSTVATEVLVSLMQVSKQEQTLMQGLAHKLYLVNSDVTPVKNDSLAKYCKKGFAVELVHATGHYPMIEKPEEFNSAIKRVIADIAK